MRARRDRTSGHAVLALVPPLGRECKEHAARERHREPVREPQVRVRLHHRRGNPSTRCGEHHRPGDVAARAENDVGTTRTEDASARKRRPPREEERPRHRRGRSPRQAGRRERVQLVPCRGNDPGLDTLRRAGEGHPDAALAQRFSDRQRRQHVAGGPAGRDQAPKLALPLHSCRRC